MNWIIKLANRFIAIIVVIINIIMTINLTIIVLPVKSQTYIRTQV